MEELSINSTTQATRLNPVIQSSNTKLEEDRLKQATVHQKLRQKDETNDKETTVDAQSVVHEVNKIVERFSAKVSFSIDPDSKKTMILVTDKETGAVIRQIPAKEMLDLMKKMEEIAGIIYSGRV